MTEMEVHLATYRCADTLGIEPLKILATALFVNAIKDNTSEFCFHIIERIYQNCISGECLLRSAVTDFVFTTTILSQFCQ